MMSEDRANGEANPSDSMRFKRAPLIRDLTGGFPSGPATIKTPLEQGEQMKATDQNTHRQKPLQWGIRI
jgi:hypothetical protein